MDVDIDLAGKKRSKRDFSEEEEDMDFDAIQNQTNLANIWEVRNVRINNHFLKVNEIDKNVCVKIRNKKRWNEHQIQLKITSK